MGQATIRVSYELLLAALGLPEGTRLINVRDWVAFQAQPLIPNTVVLVVEHEDLKPVPEGWELPMLHPHFEQRDCECGRAFVEWGDGHDTY